MARARFSIGIDLGTTNSALAFAPLVGERTPEILLDPAMGKPGRADRGADAAFFPLSAGGSGRRHTCVAEPAEPGEWIVGRFARVKAGETPGAGRPFREVVALPSRRRPVGAVSAVGIDGSGARAEDLAGTRLGADPQLSAGRLEQPVRRGRVCVRRSGHHGYRPGFLRCGGAAADDCRRRGSGLPRRCAAARGAAGGVLLLAGAARPRRELWRGAAPDAALRARAGRRYRRRHLGFQPVRTAPERQQPDPRHQARRGQRAYPARRRQYRPCHRPSSWSRGLPAAGTASFPARNGISSSPPAAI